MMYLAKSNEAYSLGSDQNDTFLFLQLRNEMIEVLLRDIPVG